MLTGAFDSSSVIFLLYRLAYNWSGGSFWPKKFFLAYLVVPAFIFVAQVFLMPSQSYKTVGELVREVEEGDDQSDDSDTDISDSSLLERRREERRIRRESVVTEITELLGIKGGERHIKKEEAKKEISGVWGALHGESAWNQIKTPWFALITLFTVVADDADKLFCGHDQAAVRIFARFISNGRQNEHGLRRCASSRRSCRCPFHWHAARQDKHNIRPWTTRYTCNHYRNFGHSSVHVGRLWQHHPLRGLQTAVLHNCFVSLIFCGSIWF